MIIDLYEWNKIQKLYTILPIIDRYNLHPRNTFTENVSDLE